MTEKVIELTEEPSTQVTDTHKDTSDTHKDTSDVKPEPTHSNDSTKTSKFVERKSITSLTEDERSIIINNYNNGVDQPYYSCKRFKNGKFRIIHKKPNEPTLAQQVLSSNERSISSDPGPSEKFHRMYTNEQLMFEHIMDLNSKYDRLMSKHKKLKRKYDALQSDIYIDDADDEQSQQSVSQTSIESVNEVQANDTEASNVPQTLSDVSNTVQPQTYSIPNQRMVKPLRGGWRSNITFL